jgi:ferredoxin
VRSPEEAAYLDRLPVKNTIVYAKSEGRRLDINRIVPFYRGTSTTNLVIYCYGPCSLLSDCQKRAKKLRYPSSHIYFEEFGGATTGTHNPFEVELKSTGQVLQVPQEKSSLQVLNEAGLELESSCLVENCGTSMVDHSHGDIVHRGTALGDEMKGDMVECQCAGLSLHNVLYPRKWPCTQATRRKNKWSTPSPL